MDSNEGQYPEAEFVQDNNDLELSHTDKIAGVLTEPASTFGSMSKFPVRTIDWLLPVFLMLLAAAISTILITSDKQLGEEVRRKQMEAIQESMQQQVDKGTITQEEANEQLEAMENRFDPQNPFMMVITFFSVLIVGFITFFVVSGVYFLFSRFVLGGDGTYVSALAVNGMVSYIVLIQVILATVLAFIFGRIMGDTSIASFLNMDKTTFVGFILAKLDIITIWMMIVLSIGLAKMYKAASTAKYFIMVFGLWILWSLLIYFGSKQFPFLENFVR